MHPKTRISVSSSGGPNSASVAKANKIFQRRSILIGYYDKNTLNDLMFCQKTITRYNFLVTIETGVDVPLRHFH